MLNAPLPEEYFDDLNSIELDNLTGYFEHLREELEEPAEEQFEYDRAIGLLPDSCRDHVHDLFNRNEIDSEVDDENLKFDLIFLVVQQHMYDQDNGQYTIPKRISIERSVNSDLVKLVERYRSEFEEKVMYKYIISLIYSDSTEKDELEKALEAAYLATQEITFQPNVAYHLSQTVINFVLRNDYRVESESLPEDEDGVRRAVANGLRPAVEIVTEPLYKAELAQALSHLDEYEEAIRFINEALDESVEQGKTNLRSSLNDLRVTIIEEKEFYQISEKADRMQERLDQISSETKEIESRLESALQETLQFIAFFAAILTVVLTSVQVVASVSSLQTASFLILILIGGILLAFSGFSLLFQEHLDIGYALRLIFVTLSGIGIIISALSVSGAI